MFKWLEELYTVLDNHRATRRELKYCETCEALKLQLSIVNDEKRELLDRLLEISKEEIKLETKELKPILPNSGLNRTWRIRQQELEANDRNTAKILREKVPVVTTNELEKELDIVTDEREKEHAV